MLKPIKLFDGDKSSNFVFRYVKSHYMHNLNQAPNFNHLGHPLNAYHLMRHVASGWNYLVENEFKNIRESHVKHEFGKSIRD